MNKPTLSIVIPAFNEARFIGELLEKIDQVDLEALGLEKQIIVINDCSTDDTAEIVRGFEGVTLLEHTVNSGKGMAVRTGLDKATGEYLIIQDADLEYDPQDYVVMLKPLLDNRAEVVYGSRYMKYPEAGVIKNLLTGKHPSQSWVAYLGGQSLSFVGLFFTGRFLSDTVTAYKLFQSPIIKNLTLETTGFELDHEISAKVLSGGNRILEVPISYYPRTVAEGKKIGLKDWFCAIKTFFRFRNG